MPDESSQIQGNVAGALLQRAAEYLAAIMALGLTRVVAGKMLGVSPGRSNGSPRASTPMPAPVPKLLRLMGGYFQKLEG
jgi:hypothetical protein